MMDDKKKTFIDLQSYSLIIPCSTPIGSWLHWLIHNPILMHHIINYVMMDDIFSTKYNSKSVWKV